VILSYKIVFVYRTITKCNIVYLLLYSTIRVESITNAPPHPPNMPFFFNSLRSISVCTVTYNPPVNNVKARNSTEKTNYWFWNENLKKCPRQCNVLRRRNMMPRLRLRRLLLGRQPISTKSVDASQCIKNRSMGAACTDPRRQTNLHENTAETRSVLFYSFIEYNMVATEALTRQKSDHSCV
jgi:hypothetical protein